VVYFVGIDLAWGSLDLARTPKQTGIAVLDGRGSLLQLRTAVSDRDIIESIEHYLQDECIVAIDAPLLVTNQTGQRPAESQLNAVYQPFDAGAHSANIRRFTAEPRGARLAKALRLDIDPESLDRARAVEVFPHLATVALFHLGRIFKYKKGSVDDRRSELLRLIGALESLNSHPVRLNLADNHSWRELREAVSNAERQVDLDRAEDPVDAVVCAYVAMYATRRPEDVVAYGNFPDNGYILTPRLPGDVLPSPRQRPTSAAHGRDSWLTTVASNAATLEQCRALVQQARTILANVEKRSGEVAGESGTPATDLRAIAEQLANASGALEDIADRM